MKINLHLTPRDKIILALLLGVVIVIGLSSLLLLPYLDKNQVLKDDLAKAQEKVLQMDLAIANANDMALQLKVAKEQVASYQNLLPEPIDRKSVV